MDTIYITAQDNARLRLLLLLSPYSDAGQREREFLRRELDRATVLPRAVERPDAIRLGVDFEYADLPGGTIRTGCLCLPAEAAETPNGISVLSRFGAAVIGCCVGNEVWWAEADHCRRIWIRRIIHAAVREDESASADPGGSSMATSTEQPAAASGRGAELASGR